MASMSPKIHKTIGFLCIGFAILMFVSYFSSGYGASICPDNLVVFPVGLIFGILCDAINPLIGICLVVIGLYKVLPPEKAKKIIPWMVLLAAIILGALAYPFVAANL
jgi:hypothetical protein